MSDIRRSSSRESAAAALRGSGIDRRLSGEPAVVLERIARGGGATRWYSVRSTDDLGQLYERLNPGSVVSFYFDDRIKCGVLDDDTAGEILDLAVQHGDAVVGTLDEDGLEIHVDLVAGPSELSEFRSALPMGAQVFFGAFPGRDDDGVSAITLTLPDADGVIREHPH